VYESDALNENVLLLCYGHQLVSANYVAIFRAISLRKRVKFCENVSKSRHRFKYLVYFTTCVCYIHHAIHITLYTSRYTHYAIHIMLYTSRYTHPAIHITLYTSRYTHYAIHIMLYPSRYTHHAMYFTLYTLRYTHHAIHITLYTSRYIYHATYSKKNLNSSIL